MENIDNKVEIKNLLNVDSKNKYLDIIIPIYNEQECIDILFDRLLKVKEKLTDLNISFIFVNDGSTDNSMSILNKYAHKYQFTKIINLEVFYH